MAKITKEMTIREVLQLDSNIAPVFLSFGMHCIGCPMSSGESIEQAASAHGVSADEMIEKLNEYLDAQ